MGLKESEFNLWNSLASITRLFCHDPLARSVFSDGSNRKKGKPTCCPFCVTQEREYYQRSRPPLLFPRSPPPPPRLSIGLASLTTKLRPSSWVPLRAWMALWASPPEPMSTNPKPRD